MSMNAAALTLIAALASMLPLAAEDRQQSDKPLHLLNQKSVCGVPVQTQRAFRGYDRAGRAVWGRDTLQAAQPQYRQDTRHLYRYWDASRGCWGWYPVVQRPMVYGGGCRPVRSNCHSQYGWSFVFR